MQNVKNLQQLYLHKIIILVSASYSRPTFLSQPHKEQDRQNKRNIEEPSCNYCCSGKPISVTYSECTHVQNAMRMHPTVVCGLSGSIIFLPHYLINDKIFGKKSKQERVLIFSTNYLAT